MSESLFIAIEGGDGSGKGTQANLLTSHLKKRGREVLKLSFPQYEKPSSYFATEYLNGNYGGINEVHPDLASLAFALDRFAAKPTILEALQGGQDIILDRYVASNLAHQGAKIDVEANRHSFYERIMNTEFNILGIPKPTHSIVLLVPPEQSQLNVDKKAERTYTTKKRDIHEVDKNHLALAKANYEQLCQLFPNEFIPINCMDGEKMRSIADIHSQILEIIEDLYK